MEKTVKSSEFSACSNIFRQFYQFIHSAEEYLYIPMLCVSTADVLSFNTYKK